MNKKLIDGIASVLKVDATKLTESLRNENTEFEIPIKYGFSESDYNSLLQNADKKGYTNGKKAGLEMLFKQLKESSQPDTFIGSLISDSSDLSELLIKIENSHGDAVKSAIAKFEADNKINIDERIGAAKHEYNILQETSKKEKLALQKLIEDTKKGYETKISDLQNSIFAERETNLISSNLANYSFEVPKNIQLQGEESAKNYITSQRKLAELLIRSTYTFKTDENGKQIPIDKTTGQPVLTPTQDPELPSNVIDNLLKNSYLPLAKIDNSGRNDKDSQQGQFANIRTREAFDAEMNRQGFTFGSTEYAVAYAEFSKQNN